MSACDLRRRPETSKQFDQGLDVFGAGFSHVNDPDADTIELGGHVFATRKKYRDVLRNPRVTLVSDDNASMDPWRVRGIEKRGEAGSWTPAARDWPGFDPELFRITHRRIVTRA